MTFETAADKIGVTTNRLLGWEQGLDQPTIAQAKKAAHVYRRPFALLMLPEPPYDFTPLRDFRRKGSTPLGTAATFIIRELREKQAWVRDWYAEQGESPLSFVGRYTMETKAAVVAEDILKELDIHPPHYADPMKEWLAKAERKGIFVSRTSYIHSHLTLNSEEFQGFVIADALAPFIFINTDDWATSQLFTLVHELVHIWIAESGISNDVQPFMEKEEDLDPVERFCNQVAAIALMPKDYMVQAANTGTGLGTSEELRRLAQAYGVSSWAFLVRLRELELISTQRYRRLKSQEEEAFREFQAREDARKPVSGKHKGGPDPHRMQVYRNGLSFSRLVMDAFRGGLIPATLASSLMGAKISDFSKLEKFAYP